MLEVGYVESVNLLAPTQARRLRVQGIVDRNTASPLSQFSGKSESAGGRSLRRHRRISGGWKTARRRRSVGR